MQRYRTVWDIIHETRLEQPLALFTDQQLADWLSEAENDIQVNVLLMVHEDVEPIVYAEKWQYTVGPAGLAAGSYQFTLPDIAADTGEEVWMTRVFGIDSPYEEGTVLTFDGEKLTAKSGDQVKEISPSAATEGTELIFTDESRRLLVPAGWARLYVDWILYQMYKAAREYRDARNHQQEWQEKRDAYCCYVAERWAPARFRG